MTSKVTVSPQKPHRRKRQRLSSPTYDDQVVLSQEQLAAFEEFDKALTQSQRRSQSPLKPSQTLQVSDKLKRDQAIAAALKLKNLEPEGSQDDDGDDRPPSPSDAYVRKENRKPRTSPVEAPLDARASSSRSPKSPKSPRPPRRTPKSPSSRVQTRKQSGFGSALNLMQLREPDASIVDDPEELPALDEDTWFESKAIPVGAAFTSFTTANAVKNRPQGGREESHTRAMPPVGLQSVRVLPVPARRAVTPEQGNPTRDIGLAEDPDFIHPSSTDVPMTVGFRTAADKDFAPSAKALKDAELKMKQWEEEFDHEFQESDAAPPGLAAPADIPFSVGFAAASVAGAPTFVGFKSLGTKTFAPSEKALKDAEVRIRRWEQEFDAEAKISDEPSSFKPSGLSLAAPALSQVEDNHVPESPTPARISGFKEPNLPMALPASSSAVPGKKPFKSPLLTATTTKSFRPPLAPHSSAYVASPLNPKRSVNGTSGFASAAAFSTPSKASTSSALATPIRTGSPPKKVLGVTPRRLPGKSKFVTPFKPGMRPGEPGRATLEVTSPQKTREPVITITPNAKGKGREVNPFLSESRRKTLADSGLAPQRYTYEELESQGINIAELKQITPETALYYAFHSSSADPFSASQVPGTAASLGPTAALDELKARGCKLATTVWVENHWSLVLWKLAGMVCLDPGRERDPERKRWCWTEVMRQLQYRYNRDLNSASRPPIRLITTHDSPPTCPMVLCVSNILWPEGTSVDDTDASPELEVTDGWYKMRAQLDNCLMKAVKKGRIRIGAKLATVGARLDSKDPAEPLEAYSTTALKLTGNSTHLAPWHAKLGFHTSPFISTLRSLSPDGGVVAVMDLVIEKAYPVAWIEFVEVDGKKVREGPRNEKDERAVQDAWSKRREDIASKLRYDLERQTIAISQYADRLEQKVGSSFRPTADDSPPDTIEDLLIDLEDALSAAASSATTIGAGQNAAANEIIKPLSSMEAGWLARAIRDKVDKDREHLSDNMETELNTLCPPREVRSFRVLGVHSYLPTSPSPRRTHTREAHLTVWDVHQLNLGEEAGSQGTSSDGGFQVGQRYVVTNLMPTQMGIWGKIDGDGRIFLSTRRDSRWNKMRN